MESNKIRELAAIMKEHELSELQLDGSGEKLHLKRSFGDAGNTPAVAYEARSEPRPSEATPVAKQTVNEAPVPTSSDNADTIKITSPMVGVFYPAPSPKEPPFVTIGQSVRAGDVLCIIDAMKMMNEIPAMHDGVITKIYPEKEQLIEFGQDLFEMKIN